MAEVTQLKRYDARPINWGKWFLIGIGMLVSAFILLVPMIYIFVQAFSKGLMPVCTESGQIRTCCTPSG